MLAEPNCTKKALVPQTEKYGEVFHFTDAMKDIDTGKNEKQTNSMNSGQKTSTTEETSTRETSKKAKSGKKGKGDNKKATEKTDSGKSKSDEETSKKAKSGKKEKGDKNKKTTEETDAGKSKFDELPQKDVLPQETDADGIVESKNGQYRLNMKDRKRLVEKAVEWVRTLCNQHKV